MFIDQETVLDEAMSLAADGVTANTKDTGAPHPASEFITGGASEGHPTFVRLTLLEDLVGVGILTALTVEHSYDDVVWNVIASRSLIAHGVLKGATIKCAIPPQEVGRYIRGGWVAGGAAGTGFVDMFTD